MNFLPLKQERTGTDAQAQTHTQTHTKENHSRGIGSQNWQNRYTKKKKRSEKEKKRDKKRKGEKINNGDCRYQQVRCLQLISICILGPLRRIWFITMSSEPMGEEGGWLVSSLFGSEFFIFDPAWHILRTWHIIRINRWRSSLNRKMFVVVFEEQ